MFESSTFSNKFNATSDLSARKEILEMLKNETEAVERNKQAQQPQKLSKNVSRLNDFVKANVTSVEKAQYLDNNELIKQKKNTLYENFLAFAFSQNAIEFDNYCEQNGHSCFKDYVDTYIEEESKYVSPLDKQNSIINQQAQELSKQAKEMEELKKIIQNLGNNKSGGDKL